MENPETAGTQLLPQWCVNPAYGKTPVLPPLFSRGEYEGGVNLWRSLKEIVHRVYIIFYRCSVGL